MPVLNIDSVNDTCHTEFNAATFELLGKFLQSFQIDVVFRLSHTTAGLVYRNITTSNHYC